MDNINGGNNQEGNEDLHLPQTVPLDLKNLPESLASTLDHIVNQMSMFSQTLSLLDSRLSDVEDRLDSVDIQQHQCIRELQQMSTLLVQQVMN